VTRLELYAVPLVVPACDGDLTKWTVYLPLTGASYASTCAVPIVVNNLVPYEEYNLQIAGYFGDELCWSGDCSIAPLPGLGILDCANAVKQVCADAAAQ
jgi:hypothetical protein